MREDASGRGDAAPGAAEGRLHPEGNEAGTGRAGAGGGRRPPPLRTQLLLGTIAVVVATSAALGLLLALFFGHYFARARLNLLTARTHTLAALWDRPGKATRRSIQTLMRDTGGHAWILGPGGAVLAEYGPPALAGTLHGLPADQRAAIAAGQGLRLVTDGPPGGRGRLAVVALPLPPGARGGARTVLWVAPVRGQDILAAVATRLAVVAGAGLLLAILLSAWLAARLAKPIRLLEEAAGQIAAGAFPPVPALQGAAEVRSLARSLRRMTEQLSDLDRQRRDFLADVSHELRTPLAAVRGALEGMRGGPLAADPASDRYLDTALHETARMGRLVDDLLALARSEAGRLAIRPQAVDLAEATLRVALSLEPIARVRGVAFAFDLPEGPVPVWADADRLSQVLWNLLDNAVRHTPPGSGVQVGLSSRADAAVLVLHNPGPVLAAEEAAGLFDRFERRDTSGGAGLGLAIARTLTQAHGGTLNATSPPEGGLTLHLTWPGAAGRGHAAARGAARPEPGP